MEVSFDKILEVAIGRRLVKLAGETSLMLRVALWRDGLAMEFIPPETPLEVELGICLACQMMGPELVHLTRYALDVLSLKPDETGSCNRSDQEEQRSIDKTAVRNGVTSGLQEHGGQT